jgi:glucokinase
VLAITASKSPLAKKATVCVPVDHNEDSATFLAMISRILHLLVVDMMAVGVAVRRDAGSSVPRSAQPGETPGDHPPGMLISHVL